MTTEGARNYGVGLDLFAIIGEETDIFEPVEVCYQTGSSDSRSRLSQAVVIRWRMLQPGYTVDGIFKGQG